MAKTQYIIMVVSHTKHDANIDVYGAYDLKPAMRHLVQILEDHGNKHAEDAVAQHDWEEGDFKWEDVGMVIQMTGVPFGRM